MAFINHDFFRNCGNTVSGNSNLFFNLIIFSEKTLVIGIICSENIFGTEL